MGKKVHHDTSSWLRTPVGKPLESESCYCPSRTPRE